MGVIHETADLIQALEGLSDGPSRRERYGARLRRARELLGLSQRAVADRCEVPQAQVSRAESGLVVDEGVLGVLEALYGWPNDYPSAPRDPVRRLEWVAHRGSWRPVAPESGTFGRGKVE